MGQGVSKVPELLKKTSRRSSTGSESGPEDPGSVDAAVTTTAVRLIDAYKINKEFCFKAPLSGYVSAHPGAPGKGIVKEGGTGKLIVFQEGGTGKLNITSPKHGSRAWFPSGGHGSEKDKEPCYGPRGSVKGSLEVTENMVDAPCGFGGRGAFGLTMVSRILPRESVAQFVEELAMERLEVLLAPIC